MIAQWDLSWIWRDLWASLPLPTIDWFWLSFAGFVLALLVVMAILAYLTKFLPDGAKPYALAIVTGGIGVLYGMYREHQRRKKLDAARAPAPRPPTQDNGGGWFGGGKW